MRTGDVEGGCPNGVRILPPAVRRTRLFATSSYWHVHPDRDTDTIPTTPADGWTIFQ